MKVLVTGGAGFIGSHIVEALLRRGHEVEVVDDLSSGNIAHVPSGVRLHRFDICSARSGEVFRHDGFDAVIHCAAQVGVPASMRRPQRDWKVNVLGTARLLEHCRRYQVSKFVFLSSGAAVYGETARPAREDAPVNPGNFYGVHKYCAERYVLFSGLQHVILRLSNVYGPRQRAGLEGGVVAVFQEGLTNGEPAHIFGTGEQTRDFVHVYDVAAAAIVALEYPGSETWNISTGVASSVRRLLGLMSKELGASPRVINHQPRAGDVIHSCLDNAKINATGLWSPQYDLEAGLKQLLHGDGSVGVSLRSG